MSECRSGLSFQSIRIFRYDMQKENTQTLLSVIPTTVHTSLPPVYQFLRPNSPACVWRTDCFSRNCHRTNEWFSDAYCHRALYVFGIQNPSANFGWENVELTLQPASFVHYGSYSPSRSPMCSSIRSVWEIRDDMSSIDDCKNPVWNLRYLISVCASTGHSIISINCIVRREAAARSEKKLI